MIMEKKHFRGLFGAWLAVGAFFISTQALLDPALRGLPLDDAWIHLSFAKNLAAGGVFGINPDEASNGSTSPLWTILLSLGCRTGFAPSLVAHALGLLFVFLSSVAVYRLAFLLLADKRAAFLSALFLLLSGRFIWGGVSGMEIPLFSALAATALFTYERARQERRVSFLVFCLFGLTSLARPEGHFLFALVVIDLLIYQRAFFKEKRRWILGGVALYVLTTLPYMLFSWLLTGRPLCGSYYSKMSFLWTYKPWDYLHAYFRSLLMDNPFLLIGMAPGLRLFWSRGQRLISWWLTLLPLCLAFVAPLMFHHARYNMPMIPFYIMAGVAGFRGFSRRWLRRVILVAALLWALFFIRLWARCYASDVSSINDQHVRVALWIKDHAAPGESVAANDVGAISFLSGRRVVDLCGIMDTGILKIMRFGGTDERRREMLRQYLAERGVRYLAVYRDWFPWITDDPSLEKVFEARLENNTAAGCDTMEVFRIHELTQS